MSLKNIQNNKLKKKFLKIFLKNPNKVCLMYGENKIKYKDLLAYICQINNFLKKKKFRKKNSYNSNRRPTKCFNILLGSSFFSNNNLSS